MYGNIFCDPGTISQSLRRDHSATPNVAGLFGTGGNCSAILGGPLLPATSAGIHTNCGDLSVILMGQCNTINIFAAGTPPDNGIFNLIGNGFCNTAAGCFSTVVNGCCNNVFGSYNNIFNGACNCIESGSNSNSVVNGFCNTIQAGLCSIIGAGSCNCINDAQSSGILSGDCNNICAHAPQSAIVGGLRNRIYTQGEFHFIGGGAENCIEYAPAAGVIIASAISGGCLNTVAGNNSFVGGGDTNNISSIIGLLNCCPVNCAVIAGGQNNTICDNGTATADYSFIGAGFGNFAQGCGSIVVGGGGNQAWGFGASIINGFENKACACGSFIGNGASQLVDVNADCSFIGGGSFNSVSGVGSVIGGGGCCDPITLLHGNSIFSNFSFIGSGTDNVINLLSDCSFVNGGQGNKVGTGTNGSIFSSIGGGQNNFIDDTAFASAYSGIFGGANHCAQGNNLFVGGGYTNFICSAAGPVLCSSIVGGWNNLISDDISMGGTTPSSLSFIGGGCLNQILSVGASIAGGINNCIFGNLIGVRPPSVQGYSFIGGGQNNCIYGLSSFIGAGACNCMVSTVGPIEDSVIGGGILNIICDYGATSFIGSGSSNCISQQSSSIVGGDSHFIGSQNAFIGGGTCNSIFLESNWSLISGGTGNTIGSAGGLGVASSAIMGGGGNCIDDTGAATGNAFLGGGFNWICAGTNGAGIFSGSENVGGGSSSFIGGGVSNKINYGSDYSFINSGTLNTIGSAGGSGATFSGISGGSQNCIDDSTAATAYGVIGGGFENCICAGTNHSSIFSGNGNCVWGSCSSVLGGSGNCDGGFDYVGIFGQGITGVCSAFHANNFVAQNMPTTPGGPSGSFYKTLIGTVCVVAIN